MKKVLCIIVFLLLSFSLFANGETKSYVACKVGVGIEYSGLPGVTLEYKGGGCSLGISVGSIYGNIAGVAYIRGHYNLDELSSAWIGVGGGRIFCDLDTGRNYGGAYLTCGYSWVSEIGLTADVFLGVSGCEYGKYFVYGCGVGYAIIL